MARGWRGQLTALVAIAAWASAGAIAPPADAAGPAVVRPTQELVVLLEEHDLFAQPDAPASRLSTVRAWRPLTGTPTVLPVLGHMATANGAEWLQVMDPGRPNGRQGWISQEKTLPTETSWHIVVKTSSRRVVVFRDGLRVRSVAAIVGKSSTPTPHGRYFVEETVDMRSGSPGAPFALALSARSNVLQQFGGGPGQIALHGVANIGGRLGTAASHGCVRLANRSIRWLAARVGPGAPVTITH